MCKREDSGHIINESMLTYCKLPIRMYVTIGIREFVYTSAPKYANVCVSVCGRTCVNYTLQHYILMWVHART